MIVTKYYYSEPVAVRRLPMLIDSSGDVVAIAEHLTPKEILVLPRITVASVYDTDTRIMVFGVAACSPEDQFVKEIGRNLAKERALSKPVNKVVVAHRDKVGEISRRYADQLISKRLKKYVRFGV